MKPVVITAEVIDTYDQAGYVRNMETYGLPVSYTHLTLPTINWV